jgi:hypothetical protein
VAGSSQFCLALEQDSPYRAHQLAEGLTAPLQDSGNGIKSIYLTVSPPALAVVLIGKEASILKDRSAASMLPRRGQVYSSSGSWKLKRNAQSQALRIPGAGMSVIIRI